MKRKHKQVPLTIYPDTQTLLAEVMKLTDNLQASVLREALNIGLKQMFNQQLSVRSPAPQEQARALLKHLQVLGFDALSPGNYYDISEYIQDAIAQWFEQQLQQPSRGLTDADLKAIKKLIEEGKHEV